MVLEDLQRNLAAQLLDAADIADGPSDEPLLIAGPHGNGFFVNANALIAMRAHLAKAQDLIDQLQQQVQ